MVKARLDDRDLQKKLKQLTKDLNKEAADSIVEMAQIGGRQLALRMEPYGLDQKTKDNLQNVVYKDINKAYDYVGQTFNDLFKINKNIAYAFSRAVKNGDLNAAEKYVKSVRSNFEMRISDGGDHLDSVRDKNGRVGKNAKIMGISNDSEIDSIKTKKVASAGMAKAGWLQAAKSLGSKARIDKFFRKSENLGTSSVDRKQWETVVYLHNKVTYVSNLLTQSKINAAVKNAYTNQVKKLERQLKHIAKKF
jgi:hypothetical protein